MSVWVRTGLQNVTMSAFCFLLSASYLIVYPCGWGKRMPSQTRQICTIPLYGDGR